MLYRFICDAADAMRLRFRPAEEYRYAPPVFIGILLLLGLMDAAGLSPLLGNTPPMIALAVCFTVLKWAVLSAVVQRRLKIPAFGFILLSEALTIPLLLAFYLPALALAAALWQLWTFAVQFIGLMRLGKASAGKVLLCYLLYIAAVLVAGTLLTTLFHLMGWLDAEAMMQQLQNVFSQN